MFLTFFNLLILIYLSPTKFTQSFQSSSHFSNIVIEKVRIIVDPIKVVIENENISESLNKYIKPICVLALHRGDCKGPKIKQSDKISWQEQICFLWKCIRADKLIMRIFDCWAGSIRSPINLIDNNGYTREHSLISTPKYNHFNHSAYSFGRLTVRLQDLDYIRLSCAIKFCSFCNINCRINNVKLN
uniref:ZP domain-containing protein n=1 Tax=Meloidogyne hapla TaxID=6305 RepID=A0A1I8BVS8_MELHA